MEKENQERRLSHGRNDSKDGHVGVPRFRCGSWRQREFAIGTDQTSAANIARTSRVSLTLFYLVIFAASLILSFVLTKYVRDLANAKGWVPHPRKTGISI